MNMLFEETWESSGKKVDSSRNHGQLLALTIEQIEIFPYLVFHSTVIGTKVDGEGGFSQFKWLMKFVVDWNFIKLNNVH